MIGPFHIDPERFNANPPATGNFLEDAGIHFQWGMPTDYKEFMALADGGEGFIGENYLILWRAGELIEFNHDYEVAIYAAGLILFGSNGGGEGYGFDLESSKVVMVPFIGMSQEDTKEVADNFGTFLKNLSDPDWSPF